jgi:flagellar motor switch protein FliM
VACSFTLEFGGSQAEMHFCFPYSMLEPIRETLYSTMQSDHITQDNRWVSMMGKQLQSAEVTLTAHLGTTRITLRDIVNMRPGDVIPLDIPETIQAEVDGIPFMECRYGVQRGQYALKIERFLAQEDETPAASQE